MSIDDIIEEVDRLIRQQTDSARFENLDLLKGLLISLRDTEDPFKAGSILRDYLDRVTFV